MGFRRVCLGGMNSELLQHCYLWSELPEPEQLRERSAISKNKGVEVISISAPEMIHASWKQLLLRISDKPRFLMKIKLLRDQGVFKLGLTNNSSLPSSSCQGGQKQLHAYLRTPHILSTAIIQHLKIPMHLWEFTQAMQFKPMALATPLHRAIPSHSCGKRPLPTDLATAKHLTPT